jgi:uncharacterized protein with NAD-binding domain and iron-sulfur cluster
VVRALFDPEGAMQDIRALDNISFTDWFKSHGGSDASIKRMWDPIGESRTLATAASAAPRRAPAAAAFAPELAA